MANTYKPGFGEFLQQRQQGVPGIQQPAPLGQPATTGYKPGFAEFLNPAYEPTQVLPEEQPGVLGDLGRTVVGGAVTGTGLAVEGLGHLGQMADELFNTGGDKSVASRTVRAGQWVQDKAESILAGRSDYTQQAIKNSQVTGTLWKPDTWDWGQDPSLRGIGMQAVEVMGQLVPILAAGVTSGGAIGAATAGGLQGGEAGRDQAEQLIEEAYYNGTLYDVSPAFKKAIDAGVDQTKAYEDLKARAGNIGQLFTSPVSALGGGATEKIFSGQATQLLTKTPIGKNLIGRVLGTATIGGFEEGLQEVAESTAAKAGTQQATGLVPNYGEGTFADFALGAMAGGPVGAVGGVRTPPNVAPAEDTDFEEFEVEAPEDPDLGGIQVEEPPAPVSAPPAETPYELAENNPGTTPTPPSVGGDTGGGDLAVAGPLVGFDGTPGVATTVDPKTGQPVPGNTGFSPYPREDVAYLNWEQSPEGAATRDFVKDATGKEITITSDKQYERIKRALDRHMLGDAGVDLAKTEFTFQEMLWLQEKFKELGNATVKFAPQKGTKLEQAYKAEFPDLDIGSTVPVQSVINLGEERGKRNLQKFHDKFRGQVMEGAQKLAELTRMAQDAGAFHEFKKGDRIVSREGRVYNIDSVRLQKATRAGIEAAKRMYERLQLGDPTLVEFGGEYYIAMVRVSDGDTIQDLNIDAFKKRGGQVMTGPRAIESKLRTKTDRVRGDVVLNEEIYQDLLQRYKERGIPISVDFLPYLLKEKNALGYANYEGVHKGLKIGLSTTMPNGYTFAGTWNHELIHILRGAGVFATERGKRVYRLLVKQAWTYFHEQDPAVVDHVRNNYPKGVQDEEALAIFVEHWTQNEVPDKYTKAPMVNLGLRWIKDFFVVLADWFRSLGITTVEDAMQFLTTAHYDELVSEFEAPDIRGWDETRYIYQWEVMKQDLPPDEADPLSPLYQPSLYPQTVQIVEDQDGGVRPNLYAPGMNEELRATQRVMSRLLGSSSSVVKNVDYYNKLVKFGWTVVQLAKKNLHIKWLQEYVQHASQWHNAKMEWLARANTTATKWMDLPPDQQNKLSAMLLEAEETVVYKSADTVDQRKLTQQEVDLVKKHKLSKEALKLYVEVRGDFRAMLEKIEQVTAASVAQMIPDNELTRDIEVQKVHNEFAKLKKTAYFPHARFGEFTIIVKDKDGKNVYVEMFENEKQRNKYVAQVKKKYPESQGYTTATSKISEEARIYAGLPQATLIALKENLNLNEKQRAMLDEMIVNALPGVSFRKHFAKRENIAGYSRDALRAYADYFWHGANHVARIEFGPLMEQAIADGQKDIDKINKMQGGDSTNRVNIKDHLSHHFDSIMNPKADWAAVRSVGFMWWLGFNVKSAVMNFTQVPLVTSSYLAANFGDAKAHPALAVTMAQLQRWYRSPDKAGTPDQARDAKLITQGVKEGFLDESFAAELAGLAEGSQFLQSRAKTATRKAVLGFQHYAGLMFQTVEKLNRRVSFMAAVKLARSNPDAKYLETVRQRYSLEYKALLEQGWTPVEATAFLAGKDTVESTQFNYSAWARPRIMEGRKSAFLTFFMFTQNMLWFIQNSPGNTRYLLLLLLFAGIQGMPGMDDLQEIVEATAQKMFGKDFDAERSLRELVMEYFGDDVPPDLVLHGISRYGFGLPHLADMMGLPLPSVDMSANIGMGSPLPVVSPGIQAIARSVKGQKIEESLGEFTAESLGATLGIPLNIYKSMADSRMEFTDPKRWEGAMPASLSALSKALRYIQEGEERSRTGSQVVEFDKNNIYHQMEMAAQALGFNPTRKSQAWDLIIAKRDAEMFWTLRRQHILNKWDWAQQSGDKDEILEVKRAQNRFNRQVPYSSLKITHETLSRSLKAREKSRAKQEAGLPNAKMMTGVYRDVEKLHPETKQDLYIEDVPSGR